MMRNNKKNKSSSESKQIKLFSKSIAKDLVLLSAIQHTELTKEKIQELYQMDFPQGLCFTLKDKELIRAVNDNLVNLHSKLDEEILDELAVDFANIYLVHTYQASPYESVWLDEESLMQQQPMFDIKKEYQKHHLEFNEQTHYADHLCLQLEFIAHLLNKSSNKSDLLNVGEFLDNHLLRWIKLFSARVAKHAMTEFYASFVVLQATYIEELRCVLEDITQTKRIEPVDDKKQVFEDIPMKFIPGVAKSW